MFSNHDEISLDTLGHKIRVDYTPDGEHGREWLRGLLSDLADEDLIEIEESGDETVTRLG